MDSGFVRTHRFSRRVVRSLRAARSPRGLLAGGGRSRGVSWPALRGVPGTPAFLPIQLPLARAAGPAGLLLLGCLLLAPPSYSRPRQSVCPRASAAGELDHTSSLLGELDGGGGSDEEGGWKGVLTSLRRRGADGRVSSAKHRRAQGAGGRTILSVVVQGVAGSGGAGEVRWCGRRRTGGGSVGPRRPARARARAERVGGASLSVGRGRACWRAGPGREQAAYLAGVLLGRRRERTGRAG